MRDIKPQGRDLNWKFKVDFPPDFLSLEMKFGIPDENPFEYSLKLSFGLFFFFFNCNYPHRNGTGSLLSGKIFQRVRIN